MPLRRLPAQLTTEQVARLLGFEVHHIPLLVSLGFLKPLSNTPSNGMKDFATVDVLALAKDPVRLTQAIDAVWADCQDKNPVPPHRP